MRWQPGATAAEDNKFHKSMVKDRDYVRAWDVVADLFPAPRQNKVSDKNAANARAWKDAVVDLVPVLTPNKVSAKNEVYARAWDAAVDSVPVPIQNRVSDRDADYARD